MAGSAVTERIQSTCAEAALLAPLWIFPFMLIWRQLMMQLKLALSPLKPSQFSELHFSLPNDTPWVTWTFLTWQCSSRDMDGNTGTVWRLSQKESSRYPLSQVMQGGTPFLCWIRYKFQKTGCGCCWFGKKRARAEWKGESEKPRPADRIPRHRQWRNGGFISTQITEAVIVHLLWILA